MHVRKFYEAGVTRSRPPAAQSWPELSMATRPGQRTLEAARGNGCTPVRGMPVMMMMIRSYNIQLNCGYLTIE